MPLSEQEQRLLDEMERNLYRHDADFVATVGGSGDSRPDYRAIVLGILVAIIGIAIVVSGVATHLPILGVAGFLVMFAGVLLSLRRSKSAPKNVAGQRPSAPKQSFMDKMNQRWDNRQQRDSQ